MRSPSSREGRRASSVDNGDARSENPYKIYIGNLPIDSREDEIRQGFREYGRIRAIECKGKFAFVEYERSQSAEDAMQAMDGRTFLGDRIIVQPHRPGLRGIRGPPAYQVVAPPPKDKVPPPTGRDRRTKYRILLFNLDERASWQDLKDFGRNAGDVNFANVFPHNGGKIGVIEYYTRETMERALSELDDRRLYRTRVHVEEDRGQLIPQSGGKTRGDRFDDNDYYSSSRGGKRNRDFEDSYSRRSRASRSRSATRFRAKSSPYSYRRHSRERSPPADRTSPPPRSSRHRSSVENNGRAEKLGSPDRRQLPRGGDEEEDPLDQHDYYHRRSRERLAVRDEQPSSSSSSSSSANVRHKLARPEKHSGARGGGGDEGDDDDDDEDDMGDEDDLRHDTKGAAAVAIDSVDENGHSPYTSEHPPHAASKQRADDDSWQSRGGRSSPPYGVDMAKEI